MLRLPRLPSNADIVKDDKPTATFSQYWQQLVQRIEQAVGLIVDLTGIQQQFEQALSDAQSATAAAQAAAAQAQAQADAAAAQAAAAKRETALQNSYIDPDSVLSATATTITIASHTRRYPTMPPTSVSVNGGTIGVTAAGDVDYVFYSDPNRAGGAVTYQVSTDQPTQAGNIHVVGAVQVPATGTNPGGPGPRRPGYVDINSTQ